MSTLGLKKYIQKKTQDLPQDEIQDSSKTTTSFSFGLKDYVDKNKTQDFSIAESNADSLMKEKASIFKILTIQKK